MHQRQSESKNYVVISLGDPAGIGIEVTLKALGSLELPSNCKALLVGCKKSLELIYLQLESQGVKDLPKLNELVIEDLPLESHLQVGQPNVLTGAASFHWLTRATELVMHNQARALITAPIAKHNWYEAGHNYPGQTERLMELSGENEASMLFTALSPKNNWRFNTLLATTHIPLKDVPQALTPKLINSKLNVLINFCKKFTPNPRIIVAGLNPHAGENGKIGHEEIKWLKPLLEEYQNNHPDIRVEGPVPPDTCWISAAQAWHGTPSPKSPDGILALYHDQGLIPVKLIAFEQAVNTTLGLSFLRTSPDHGTGFDIAGKGCANSGSMLAAIKTAWELTKPNHS